MPPAEPTLADIREKLDILIKLLASLVGNGLPLGERAPLLQRTGLNRNEIAAVCNTTAEAVSVRLAEAKRKPKKKKR